MNSLLQKTTQFVKSTLANAEKGHDYFHIQRVQALALTIAQKEIQKGKQVDLILVQLGALLHDIADQKFHNGDETIAPKVATDFLQSLEVDQDIIQKVCDIINEISFKGSKMKNEMSTLEGAIVQDADRLDALGAIGIARCFTYGGFKNRVLHDPEQQPQNYENYEQYKNNQSTTINHFYEKLFHLKDLMNTESGREMAEVRHKFMVDYVTLFKQEWDGVL